MSRIRTIKPDFWHDCKTGKLSDSAKCLFLGILNFCDDVGVIEFNVEELRVKVWPYKPLMRNNTVCRILNDELIKMGIIVPFSVEGRVYLWVKNFLKHQVVKNPSQPIVDNFDSVKHVFGSPTVVLPDSSRSPNYGRKEGRKERKEGVKQLSSPTTPQKKDAFVDEVVEIYNQTKKHLPTIGLPIHPKRATAVRKAAKHKAFTKEKFKRAVEIVDDLRRQCPTVSWLDFDFFFREEGKRIDKIIEGGYDYVLEKYSKRQNQQKCEYIYEATPENKLAVRPYVAAHKCEEWAVSGEKYCTKHTGS